MMSRDRQPSSRFPVRPWSTGRRGALGDGLADLAQAGLPRLDKGDPSSCARHTHRISADLLQSSIDCLGKHRLVIGFGQIDKVVIAHRRDIMAGSYDDGYIWK